MKKIFVVDWALLILFLLTAGTGVGMHVAGHGTHHATWAVWAWVHSLFGLLFVGFVVWHVKMHIGWYKSLFKGRSGKPRHPTIILTLMAAVVTLSGLVMLAVAGANSDLGLWHYGLGLLFSLIAVGHIARRLSILRKSLQ